MKKIGILFMLTVVIFSNGCKTQKSTGTGETNEITITGIAEHAKTGAIVVTEDKTYYIANKDNWDKEGYYKKKVRVTGILETRTMNESLINDKGEHIQGSTGTTLYIQMSSCKLVN